MITKLTKAQEKKISIYLKKWQAAGYRTKTTDQKKATKAIHFLYEKIMQKEKPKYIVFLDSPMACQLAANLLKNTKFDSSQLRSQLDSQLYSQLDSQLYSQLDSHLDSQLYSQLDSQLYSQLSSQLSSQLRSQKLEYFYWSPNLWWWPGWTGFYDFVLNELFPKKKKEFKLFNELTEHWQEVHYYLLFPEIVFVSDFPKEIHINKDRFQLHNSKGPALLYRDTYSLYKLNGVTVTKEQAEAETFSKEEILNEKNADVRRELIRKIGIEKAMDILGAKVIDTYKSKIGGKYELLSINYDDRGERPYLRMTNPSMNLVHIEGVRPNTKTVKEAICYRNKLETFEEPQAIS